ncbi:MAG TPA: sensor histidine kinase [Chitinophagaceae bacterium]|nr:sensor histidine kinase [Chitinophagaceae bacterium]
MKSLTTFVLWIACLSALGQPAAHSKADWEKADSLHALARRLIARGKQDSAALVINQGIALAEKLGRDTLLCKFYLERVSLTSLRGDKKAALQLLQTTVAPLLGKSTPHSIVDKYYNIAAVCYRTLLQYDSAIYYLREVEKLNNLHYPYHNWLVYYQMALTFMQANLPEQAEQYFWKSYAITKPAGKRKDHGVLLNEFATFLSRRNMPEKFALILREYHQFIGTVNKNSYDPIHSMLWVDYGDITTEGKVKFMTSVKQSLLNNGDIYFASYANNYIARYYEDNRQYDEALKCIQENLGRFNDVHYPEYQYVNTAAAYRLLKKLGRHEEAVKEADRLLKLKDSIAAGLQQEKIMELEAKYQSEKQEREIAILNSQNALNEANLRNEKNYSLLLASENLQKDARIQKEMELKAALNRENDLIASQARLKDAELRREKNTNTLLIGGAVLLMLSVMTILYLYRKQRSKNILIQKQADDLEVLMKEIHHRVKNNMQIVSSLLDLQSNSIKDSQAAEAVKEGKNRVQSMAIIHQQLYQDGNIRGIKMDDYINMLTQNIFSSYNINPDKISLTTDIEKLNLDVDTVIPLGLIINELVSNSLKYAFNNTVKGTVSISLKEKDDCLELLVKDNGKGFPNGLNVHKTRSFGLQLVTAFSQKLKAHLDFYNDNGAAVLMRIKKFRLATV